MLELPFQRLDPQLFFADILRKAARIFLKVIVLDLDDPVDDSIQEVAVVRNDNERSAQVLEPFLKPL